MTLSDICEMVERAIPTARATAVPTMNQIIVTFVHRPGVEVNLLTPWYQNRLASGKLTWMDCEELINELHRIAHPTFH